MKHGTMRFDGMTLHHNPHTLYVSDSVTVDKEFNAELSAVVKQNGKNPTIVKGEGVFYGENAFEQYLKLKALCEKGSCGILSVSGIYPFYALLYDLKLTCKSIENVVEYVFYFVEVPYGKEISTFPQYCIVEENQDLWDISEKHGIAIEKLIACNPQISSLNSVSAGDKIFLSERLKVR